MRPADFVGAGRCDAQPAGGLQRKRLIEQCEPRRHRFGGDVGLGGHTRRLAAQHDGISNAAAPAGDAVGQQQQPLRASRRAQDPGGQGASLVTEKAHSHRL